MIKKSILLLSFFVPAVIYSQTISPEIKQVLDTTFHYTKLTSLYSKNVNWDSLEKKVVQLAANAQTVKALQPALECLLNGLNDAHGRYLDAGNYGTIASFTNWKTYNAASDDKRIKDDKTHALINDVALKFSYSLLNNHTGYIRIVGIGPQTDMQKEAENIRNAVTELYQKKATDWIIDLRYNGGGNMNPMMAGIAPLIGNGFVGYLSNFNNDTLSKWTIKNNNFWWDNYQAVELHNKPVFKQQPKIAVLLSRYTVSSGEFVATALKGRANTRFFGEASGGLTTNTNWITIGKELIICISSGIYCDRNGNIYTKNIPVDEAAAFVPMALPAADPGIIAAQQWLNKQ